MPEGVDVVVADGVATIDFVDPSKKGPGLAALTASGEPVNPLTRSGPRRLYETSEANARAAGLLDEPVEAFNWPDTSSATDVSGFVETPGPSARNLHAQEVRTGTYADAYGGTTVITNGDGSTTEVGAPTGLDAPELEAVQLSQAEYSALSDAGELEPGKVYMVATEVQPGETAELVSEDTGGPHTELPVIDNQDGTTELTPPAFDDGGVVSGAAELTNTGDAETVSLPPADTEIPADEAAAVVDGAGVEHTGTLPVKEQPATGYEDGKPDSDWSRPAMEKYATEKLGFADASQAAYSNRAKLLAAINEEIARREAAEQAE